VLGRVETNFRILTWREGGRPEKGEKKGKKEREPSKTCGGVKVRTDKSGELVKYETGMGRDCFVVFLVELAVGIGGWSLSS